MVRLFLWKYFRAIPYTTKLLPCFLKKRGLLNKTTCLPTEIINNLHRIKSLINRLLPLIIY
jgi:hypothetical protein